MSAIREQYRLDFDHGIHGIKHWAVVRVNGLALAEKTGARKDVIELFAVLHDACRHSDGRDLDHGPRAAELTKRYRGVYFELDDAGMDLLIEAIHDHTGGKTEADPTIQTCWDADRLDLPRVGILVNPQRLCTDAGREVLAERNS